MQIILGPAESSYAERKSKDRRDKKGAAKLSGKLFEKAKITGTGFFLSSAILYFPVLRPRKTKQPRKRKKQERKMVN